MLNAAVCLTAWYRWGKEKITEVKLRGICQPFYAGQVIEEDSSIQGFTHPQTEYQLYRREELRQVDEDRATWIVTIVDETGSGGSGPNVVGLTGTEMPRLNGGTLPLSEIRRGDILMV